MTESRCNPDSAPLDSRALGAGIDPRLDELAELLLRSRRGRASGARVPGPGDEVILGEMLLQQRQVASAVPGGILELRADLAHRLSFPGHLDRREAPARMARDACVARFLGQREIALRVTGGAGSARDPDAAVAAARRRHVGVPIVALERAVGCRMAIHAAGIHDHFRGFGEKRARARLGILDARELRWRPQRTGILRRRTVAAETQEQRHATRADEPQGGRTEPRAVPTTLVRNAGGLHVAPLAMVRPLSTDRHSQRANMRRGPWRPCPA